MQIRWIRLGLLLTFLAAPAFADTVEPGGGGSGGMSETPSWSGLRRHPLWGR